MCIRLSFLLVISCGLLPACRGYAYRKQQLDLVDHTRVWRGRLDDVEPVRAYARRLADVDGETRGDFDLEDDVTLEEGEMLALLFHPEARVARLEARVPMLGARQAGLPDDPAFELDLLRILESVASPWIAAGGVAFTVPLAGRRTAQHAQAHAEARAAWRAAQLAEWNVVLALRFAWNDWTADRERADLLEDHLASVNDVLKIARTQKDAEQIGAPDVRVLELEHVTRAGELTALRLKLERHVRDLKAAMGLTPHADIELVPGFSQDPRHVSLAFEEARLRANNLELAVARARYEAADATLRTELQKQYPDLQIGPLLETEEGRERLGLGVSGTLPIWNRNRRAIVEACAARDAAKGAYEARYEMLIAKLATSRGECRATGTRTAWLRDRVAPLADEQLQNLRELGALGDMNVLILRDALTTVLETKFQLVDARLERARAAVRRRALVQPLRTPTAARSRK